MLNMSSGSYSVRDTEMRRDVRPLAKLIRCRIHFLDDSEGNFEIEKQAKGQLLLDKVFEHLELIEKDYFGLQFTDNTSAERNTRWLDPLKMVRKQIPAGPPYILYFRVKFYVSDPSKLREEYTRYHVFLQVKKDVLEGRLVAPFKNAAVLASYAVQSELGDYNPDEHTPGYLSVFRFIPGQTEEFEQEVCELHRQHRGQTPADAEFNYLDNAKRLDMYGAHLYSAQLKDKSSVEMLLGVTSVGLVVFQNNARFNTFSWSKIVKISFKRNHFFIQLRKEAMDTTENLIGFNMTGYRQCKNLWKASVEHHTFFRLHAPPPVHGGLFSFSAKFRFSGRTEFETLEESKKRARTARIFTRSPSKRYARRTVAVTTREAILNSRQQTSSRFDGYGANNNVSSAPPAATPSLNSYSTADGDRVPNSAYSSITRQPVNSWTSSRAGTNSVFPSASQEPSEPVLIKPVAPNSLRSTLPSDYKPSGYVSSASRVTTSANRKSTYANTNRDTQPRSATTSRTSASDVPNTRAEYRLSRNLDNRGSTGDTRRHSRTYDGGSGRVNGHRNSRAYEPRSVVTPDRSSDCGDSVTKDSGEFYLSSAASTMKNSIKSYVPTDYTTRIDHSSYDPVMTSNNGASGFVTIRIKPDSQGRFGFNVKGGADQGLPIIVSRVAPNTPADLCLPRLNEGDQVLYINGRDISSLTHEQVVVMCRNLRQARGGEMVLVVKPNVYIAEDVPDEPDFQFIPDGPYSPSSLPPGGDLLARSLQQLQEGLSSGTVMTQFEQLFRKKPGFSMDAARLPENLPKNRYRDISPYDQTRVVLKGTSGDYINANFVNMEIARSGIVNRYIAAQGPLPTTTADFWQMIWEQRSSLIVMLTTESERGRVKCHQYWPEPFMGPSHYGRYVVKSTKEEITPSFAFREFGLKNPDSSKEERFIRQMQYMAWPDHGVPNDSSDFLEFVSKVRQNRTGMVEPTIVHCSAGIGRTGVLITMETAMCLIETNQPIYPLDIVRQMREQRAMLIQTSSQFHFVCEAILKVYNDKAVQPLEDFK